jgi:hypothetical protein
MQLQMQLQLHVLFLLHSIPNRCHSERSEEPRHFAFALWIKHGPLAPRESHPKKGLEPLAFSSSPTDLDTAATINSGKTKARHKPGFRL